MSVRDITLNVFATDESASVQVRSLRGRARTDPELTLSSFFVTAGPPDHLHPRSLSRLIPRDAVAQATLYKIGQEILKANAGVQSVRIALPNKHYIPVDMKYIGIDNLTPYVSLTLESALRSCFVRAALTGGSGAGGLIWFVPWLRVFRRRKKRSEGMTTTLHAAGSREDY